MIYVLNIVLNIFLFIALFCSIPIRAFQTLNTKISSFDSRIKSHTKSIFLFFLVLSVIFFFLQMFLVGKGGTTTTIQTVYHFDIYCGTLSISELEFISFIDKIVLQRETERACLCCSEIFCYLKPLVWFVSWIMSYLNGNVASNLMFLGKLKNRTKKYENYEDDDDILFDPSEHLIAILVFLFISSIVLSVLFIGLFLYLENYVNPVYSNLILPICVLLFGILHLFINRKELKCKISKYNSLWKDHRKTIKK